MFLCKPSIFVTSRRQIKKDPSKFFSTQKSAASCFLSSSWCLGVTNILGVPLKGYRRANRKRRHYYNTIQYNTIQYNTIQYNTIQYNTIQYNTIQYNTIQYNTLQVLPVGVFSNSVDNTYMIQGLSQTATSGSQ